MIFGERDTLAWHKEYAVWPVMYLLLVMHQQQRHGFLACRRSYKHFCAKLWFFYCNTSTYPLPKTARCFPPVIRLGLIIQLPALAVHLGLHQRAATPMQAVSSEWYMTRCFFAEKHIIPKHFKQLPLARIGVTFRNKSLQTMSPPSPKSAVG